MQPVLPLHECATEAHQDAAKSIADPIAIEPLHTVADPTGSGATLTETFSICVWF
jgi:hypothetical protein